MIGVILYFLFMIPVSFIGGFWINHVCYFVLFLLFYTLLASLPIMICVFYVDSNEFTLNFCLMKGQLNILMFYSCLNTVFFVKMPMYFVHLWLPNAHVEALVSGSIILAGIMLKLGGYGLVRLMAFVIPVAESLITYLWLLAW